MIEQAKNEVSQAEKHMKAAITHLETELSNTRAGRATPAMLNGIMVEYYGAPTPITQVANVKAQDGRTLVVEPWEKNLLGEVERAIFGANLGVTPQNDGKLIRISLPPLTEERRAALAKQVKAYGEEAKVSIRNNRKDANNAIKRLTKDGLSEDLEHRYQNEVQTITNKYSELVDKHVQAKEKEIMTI